MWGDIVIAAQMKRLNIKEIYSNDNDFDKIPWIKKHSSGKKEILLFRLQVR